MTTFWSYVWLEEIREVAATRPDKVDPEPRSVRSLDIRIELGGDLLSFDGRLFYASRKSSDESTL